MPVRLPILMLMNALPTWLCRTCFLLVFTSGCAAITPALTGSEEVETNAAALEIYEGRPTSAVLQLSAKVSTADTIELWRAVDGDEPELIQDINLDDAIQQQMADSGVLLIDHPPLGALNYMVVFRSKGQMTQATAPLEIQWSAGPEPPTLKLEALSTAVSNRQDASAPTDGQDASVPKPDARVPEPDARVPSVYAVRLTWDHPTHHGCAVFRRDLLTDEAPEVLTRMKASCTGVFLDVSVRPSGVYSYRVATSDLSQGFPRYSEPSVETYITIPEDK